MFSRAKRGGPYALYGGGGKGSVQFRTRSFGEVERDGPVRGAKGHTKFRVLDVEIATTGVSRRGDQRIGGEAFLASALGATVVADG
jgi:hypothetical protein